MSASSDESSGRVRQRRARTRGRPNQEDTAAIERRLLAVALREFIAKGYGGSSLNQIVKKAGVSKTTLWSRFRSKEDLFREIMRSQIERLDAAAVLKPRDSRPVLELEEGLKAYANHMLSLSLEGDLLEVNRLLASEALRFPELATAIADRAELGIKRIARFIEDCARADGVKCNDPEAAAQVFIFMLRGWHANAMTTNQKVSTAARERWVARAVRTLLASRADW